MKWRAVILGVGALYIVSVGVMFVFGLGIPAAYLTMPGWFVISVPTTLLPSGAFDVAASWTGNLVILMLSAALNVAALYVLALVWSKHA